MTSHGEKKTGHHHPTDIASADPLDQPVSAATGARLLVHIGLTEREALAILSAEDATPEELSIAMKVDLHAMAAALDEATVHALVTDSKIDLGAHGDQLEARAASLRTSAAAEDKLQHVVDALHGAARLDATVAQDAINAVVPQIRTRARVNPAVRTVYSSILAYQRSRFPGVRGKRGEPDSDATPAVTGAAGPKD
jgi:hypothetical protein